MCGIAGIFDYGGTSEVDSNLLARMTEAIAHRGPDGHGYFIDPGLGFGHRRLSIIDPEAGQQPFFSADGNIVLTYNGEIYNFQEIEKELVDLGYEFRTRCDTEVIVYAWAEWGPECVKRFRGMFAFALWDRRSQTLFLARDRLGIKPVYFAMLPGRRLLFASELKALLLHPDCPKNFDYRAIEDYFAYGYIPEPRTVYADIFKLQPGHRMTIRRGDNSPQPEQYWDISFQTRFTEDSQELRDELIERLKEAVRLRLISDVPLGAFLSGGVDSSAVVALMAQITDSPVKTCSIGFDRKDHDESSYAQTVAARYHTDHNSRVVDPDDFDLVDRLAGVYDEPFADSSAMPTYRVCELARRRVTVALSGDGGDEIFAGYRRHRWYHFEEQLRGRVPAAVRRPLFGALGSLYPKLDWAPRFLRAKSTLQAIALDSAEAYFHSLSVIPDAMRRRMYTDRLGSELQGYSALEVMRQYMDSAPVDDPLARVQYTDLKLYLPADILTKVDRASMAHSLEVRVPILDHVFLEWAAGLDMSLRLRGREGKYLFKKALGPYVPHDVMYREKMGFAVPLAAWFRGPLYERVKQAVQSPVLGDTGLLDMDYLAGLVEQHRAGTSNHASLLWAVLMFESSLRQVLLK